MLNLTRIIACAIGTILLAEKIAEIRRTYFVTRNEWFEVKGDVLGLSFTVKELERKWSIEDSRTEDLASRITHLKTEVDRLRVRLRDEN